MTQVYSVPSRENNPYSLPDAEVFYMGRREMISCGEESVWWNEGEKEYFHSGWYYWCCFPGCLPDSEPFGPYETEAEATAAAQEDSWEDDDDGEEEEETDEQI